MIKLSVETWNDELYFLFVEDVAVAVAVAVVVVAAAAAVAVVDDEDIVNDVALVAVFVE